MTAAPEYDDILDGLFHGCALAAYLDQAAEKRGLAGQRGDETARQRLL
jgi:hypothetical protein